MRGTTLARALGAGTAALGISLGVAAGTAGEIARAATPRTIHSVNVYVSPSGRDSNPGTRVLPFQSLGRAQTDVRSVLAQGPASVTVTLSDGTYRLSHPLALTHADSPSPDDHVTWRAANGAHPVITGAMRVGGWKVWNTKANVWVARVPASLRTRQLYVNGARAFLAAGPLPVQLTRTPTGYTAASSVMDAWRNPQQIEFGFMQQLGEMVEPICPIASISGLTITMAEPCWSNSTERVIPSVDVIHGADLVGYGTLGIPTVVENAYEVLTKPGQFYLDGQAHRLYYIPRTGQNMQTADVEAPALQTLVKGSGSARWPVENISFQSLQFAGTTWLQPASPNGFSEVQAGFTLTGQNAWSSQGLCAIVPGGSCPYGNWTAEPAAVSLAYQSGIDFTNDQFVHLGAGGIAFRDGSKNDSVTGSVFTDISGNGVMVGGVDHPLATGSRQVDGIDISDNHVYDIGVEFPGAIGIILTYGADCTITHNQIDHVPYTAISIGWAGWLDKIRRRPPLNSNRNDVVSDNLIYDFMQEMSDGGGIYTLGLTGTSFSTGLKVTANVIHDQLDWSYALKADDSASWVTYAQNVLYDDDDEYGSPHHDYGSGPGKRFKPPWLPLKFIRNYWQTGLPDSDQSGMVLNGNHTITGPSEVPPAILANAGLQAGFRSVHSWQLPGQLPGAPTDVHVLYSFDSQSYVSWNPGLYSTKGGVTAYELLACPVIVSRPNGDCRSPAVAAASIPAGQYHHNGYGIIPGLTTGETYTFVVTPEGPTGDGASSLPSVPLVQGSRPAVLPPAPLWIKAKPQGDHVSLQWAAPAPCGNQPWPGTGCVNPLLEFAVTITGAGGTTVYSHVYTGLSQLILSNTGTPWQRVVSGLKRGATYSVTVAGITPAGAGPPTPATTWVQG